MSRLDGRTATLAWPGRPDRMVALHRRDIAELLAEELRRLDPDDVYAETLARIDADGTDVRADESTDVRADEDTDVRADEGTTGDQRADE